MTRIRPTRTQVREHAERIQRELARLPDGIEFVLILAADDWETSSDPTSIATMSSLSPSARLSLFNWLRKLLIETLARGERT